MHPVVRKLVDTATKYAQDGYPIEAINYWKQVLKFAPKNEMVLLIIGDLYRSIGDLQHAESFYLMAQKFATDMVLPTCRLAAIEERKGNLQKAKELLHNLVRVARPNVNALSVWANVCRRTGEYKLAIEALKIAITQDRSHEELTLLHSGLARNYDSTGDYESAFRHFEISNSYRNQKYSPKERSRQTDIILSVPPLTPINYSMPQTPVLIVGFMRSGSTLLEQSLGRHSQISTCGEVASLRAIAEQIPSQLGFHEAWPIATRKFTKMQAQKVGLLYLSEMQRFGTKEDCKIVVDKSLSNYELLQLAHRILPNVKIIHCVRDPIDTCLSCFVTHFSQEHGFTTRLDWLAHEYGLYRKVMAYQHQSLDIHTVEYEKLVKQPRQAISAVLDHIGLKWEEVCMQPEKNQRVVATASYAQVNQSFHTKSIGKSQNYLRHLEPLINALKQ